MAEEKAIEKDQETKTPAGVPRDELSDEDFEKVAGGQAVDSDTENNTCRVCIND
jgi:hypothetical protein